jgi:hypothetical protein
MKKEENTKAGSAEFAGLVSKEKRLMEGMKNLIVATLRENDGKILFTPEDEDGEYPVSATLWGKYDNPVIDITEVRLGKQDTIFAGGIDRNTGIHEKDFEIYPEQYSDVLYFIAAVLEWKVADEERKPLELTILFGSDVIREYSETGEFPSEEWLNENGGVIDTKTFESKEQMNAYLAGLNDADGWVETLVLDEFMVKLLNEDRKSGF